MGLQSERHERVIKGAFRAFLTALVCLMLISSPLNTPALGHESVGRGDELFLIRGFQSEFDHDDYYTEVEVLDEYGTHTLVRASEDSYDLLKEKYNAERLNHRNELHIKGHVIDTTECLDEQGIGSDSNAYDPSTEGLYIVDMIGPVNPDWRDALEEEGVKIVNYVPNYAYIVSMTREEAEAVEDKFFVDWVGIYHPVFKIDQDIEPGRVNIRAIGELSSDFMNRLNSRLDVVSVKDSASVGSQITVENAPLQYLELLAEKENVYYISNAVEPELHDEVASQVIGGGVWYWDPDDDPYNPYRGSGDHGAYVNQLGWSGESVTMAVADTGVNPDHADFQDRVYDGYYWSGTGWDDGHGHGSHVAGSAAGHTHGGTEQTVDEFGTIHNLGPFYAGQGLSYESDIYSVRIFDSMGGWAGPDDYFEIPEVAAQNSDTYVHVNSWGTTQFLGSYLESSEAYDAAARDANRDTGDNEPMVLVVAAGNDGPDDNTVGAPATAKNVIGVAASENFMPEDEQIDPPPDNPNRIAQFSSRGWTDDNRVKPDVAAPGDGIISTGDSGDEYLFMSGTSMACPAVSGAASLVVEWYESEMGVKPSPAMVRGLLINSAYDMRDEGGGGIGPGEFPGPIPNELEGWGQVNLPFLMDADAPYSYMDQGSLLETGDVDEFKVSHEDGDEPLKLTLTWTDKEAHDGDTWVLKNDLNLEVESPSGDVYTGNAFSDGMTPPGEGAVADFDENNDGWDDVNNVQNVYISPGELESGDYTVRVIGEDVPVDATNDGLPNQDYALAGYNTDDIAPPPEAPSIELTHPTGGEVFQYDDVEQITWETEPGEGNIQHVDLEYSIDGGNTWDYIATSIPDTGTYDWTIPQESSQEAKVRATVHDDQPASGSDLSEDFTISALKLSHPEPPDGADGVDPDPYLSILVDDALGRELDVEFYDVSSDLMIDEDTQVPSGERAEVQWEGLLNEQTYEWYVRVDLDSFPVETDVFEFTTRPELEVFFQVDILTEADEIPQNQPLDVEYRVENTGVGPQDDTQTIEFKVDETTYETESVTLGPGEWVEDDFVWTPEELGNKTLEVKSEDDCDTLDVWVREEPYFSLTLISYDDEIIEGEYANATVEVENEGALSAEERLELVADDETLDSLNVSLEAGMKDVVTLVWDTSLGDSGEYDVDVDGSDETVSYSLHVLVAAEFNVIIDSYVGYTDMGDVWSLEFRIVNEGEEEGTKRVNVSVDGEVKRSGKRTLGPSHVDFIEFKWVPDEAGLHNVTVSTEDDNKTIQVMVLEEGDFRVDIYEHTDEAMTGGTVSVKYSVSNHNTEDTKDVDYIIDDDIVESYSLRLDENSVHYGVFEREFSEPGHYDISISTEDDKDTVSIEVGEGDPPHFEFLQVDYPEDVSKGEDVVFEFEIANSGDVDDSQVIELVCEDDEDVVNTIEISLSEGETKDESLEWSDATSEVGTLQFSLQSENDFVSGEIAVHQEPLSFHVDIRSPEDEDHVGVDESIDIEIFVENKGRGGVDEITLVNNGHSLFSDDFSLQNGEKVSEEVTWIPDETGTFTLRLESSSHEDDISLNVGEDRPFVLELEAADGAVREGQTFAVAVGVLNTGTVERDEHILLRVNGEFVDYKSVQLEAGESKLILLEWHVESADEYYFEVGGDDDEIIGSFEVESSSDSEPFDPSGESEDGWILVLLVFLSSGIVFFSGYCIFGKYRKKNHI